MGAADVMMTVPVGKDGIEGAWRRLTDELRAEHGYGGYSGTLKEKHGYQLMATVPDKATLKALVDLLRVYDGEPEPIDRAPCATCHGQKREFGVRFKDGSLKVTTPGGTKLGVRFKDGSLKVTTPGGTKLEILSAEIVCRGCAGTGTMPLTAEQVEFKKAAIAAEKQKRAETLKAAHLNEAGLTRMISQFDDKWGDAVAIAVGAAPVTVVWFGGMCSE